MNKIVILGSGLAGYAVARELRRLDADIGITLVSRDGGDFYSKPMLSNAYAQHKEAAELVQTPAAQMAQQLDIELINHCEVHALDAGGKRLSTTRGMLGYERLVIAAGADPIRLPLQGNAADAVLSVNDLDDYARLRDVLRNAKRVAILGGGLIGCEFANDLATAGFSVSVIDPAGWPLASLLPQQAGEQLLQPLAALGVGWHFGVAVNSVDIAASGYELTLSGGASLQADVVLSAVGLRPRVDLAKAAGLAVNRGIVVDAGLRSSDPDIFALGDCAEITGRVQPFVLPIMHSARALARTLAGTETPVDFPAMPVVVKTPAHPVAVLPVARDAAGAWQMLANGNGVKMAFRDGQDRMTGFVLTGAYTGERNEMAKQAVVAGRQ